VGTDSNPLVFSFDLYDPTGGGTRDAGLAVLVGTGGAGVALGAGLDPATVLGGYDQTKYQGVIPGASIQLDTPRSVGWHTFQLTIRSTTADLRIDGNLDAKFTNLHFPGGAFTSCHLGRSTNSTARWN
jgi:hypothetical protein